jgi:hypothetical protein
MSESNDKRQLWAVDGAFFRAFTKEDALKYAQEFFAGPDGSETDTRNLTLADVNLYVAPPLQPQSVDPERLRQFAKSVWSQIELRFDLTNWKRLRLTCVWRVRPPRSWLLSSWSEKGFE